MSTTETPTDDERANQINETTEVTRYECQVTGCDINPKSSKAALREHLITDHPFDARLDTGIEAVTVEIDTDPDD